MSYFIDTFFFFVFSSVSAKNCIDYFKLFPSIVQSYWFFFYLFFFSMFVDLAAMPVAGGRLMLPELCAPIHQGRDMQTVITKQFSSSSQSIKHFSGGNLLQEENLFSTKANFFADSLCGKYNSRNSILSCKITIWFYLNLKRKSDVHGEL